MKKFLKGIGVFLCSVIFVIPLTFAFGVATILAALFDAEEEYYFY